MANLWRVFNLVLAYVGSEATQDRNNRLRIRQPLSYYCRCVKVSIASFDRRLRYRLGAILPPFSSDTWPAATSHRAQGQLRSKSGGKTDVEGRSCCERAVESVGCPHWSRRRIRSTRVISQIRRDLPSVHHPSTGFALLRISQTLSLRTFTPVTWKCFAACSMWRSFV